jgi:hypothetical protein
VSRSSKAPVNCALPNTCAHWENSRVVVMIMVLHNTLMARSDTPGTHV